MRKWHLKLIDMIEKTLQKSLGEKQFPIRMKKGNVPEWKRFSIGPTPPTDKWICPDCRPLTDVGHVAHIDIATRIVADRQITAGLVFDKSKLNTERILVVWLSPNDWSGAGGFRYGNVRFQFDWPRIINGMKYYWVESIAYGVEACRILVTSKDYSQLDRYDPTRRDGPWWYDANNHKHYWNGDFCLEIMLEENLVLAQGQSIGFVDHHKHRCSIDPQNCPERGITSGLGSALFLSTIVSRELDISLLNAVEVENGQKVANFQFRSAWHYLEMHISNRSIKYRNKIAMNDPSARSITRAILDAASRRNDSEMEPLMSLFGSQKEVLNECAMVVAEYLGISEISSF